MDRGGTSTKTFFSKLQQFGLKLDEKVIWVSSFAIPSLSKQMPDSLPGQGRAEKRKEGGRRHQYPPCENPIQARRPPDTTST